MPEFKSAKSILKMATITLRIMTRSNCSCGMKVLERTIIYHIENDLVVKSHLQTYLFPIVHPPELHDAAIAPRIAEVIGVQWCAECHSESLKKKV